LGVCVYPFVALFLSQNGTNISSIVSSAKNSSEAQILLASALLSMKEKSWDALAAFNSFLSDTVKAVIGASMAAYCHLRSSDDSSAVSAYGLRSSGRLSADVRTVLDFHAMLLSVQPSLSQLSRLAVVLGSQMNSVAGMRDVLRLLGIECGSGNIAVVSGGSGVVFAAGRSVGAAFYAKEASPDHAQRFAQGLEQKMGSV